jgi:hypothetical protein
MATEVSSTKGIAITRSVFVALVPGREDLVDCHAPGAAAQSLDGVHGA